ncbi:MAG: homoserine/homoserine lactone efflux protein [Burkholderiaceae bacterium]|jgi:homoserine/homoserine lactone efflux protein
MELTVWMTYFVACWVIAVSPGSGAVICMSHGLAYGVKKTSATVLGLQLGLAVVLLIAGAGVGAVLVASANAFLVVKVVGAAYLFYLGVKQWRASVGSSESAVADATQAVASGLSKRIPTTRERVLTGMLTNLSNPKGIVFMVAVLPQFIDPSKSLLVQLAILCVTMNAVDTVVMHGYAFLASRLQTLMRSVKAQRNQNRLFGGVLMLMGTSLLLVRRGTT